MILVTEDMNAMCLVRRFVIRMKWTLLHYKRSGETYSKNKVILNGYDTNVWKQPSDLWSPGTRPEDIIHQIDVLG